MTNKFPQGVALVKKTGKYSAKIQLDKKRETIGRYDTPEEAGQAYIDRAGELGISLPRRTRKEDRDAARIRELEDLLSEMDKYLDINDKTFIAGSSIFHKQIKQALEKS